MDEELLVLLQQLRERLTAMRAVEYARVDHRDGDRRSEMRAQIEGETASILRIAEQLVEFCSQEGFHDYYRPWAIPYLELEG